MIQGAIKRNWIYVGKIAGKEVTEENIAEFLKDVNKTRDIVVKKLNTKGQNSAFSIGITNTEVYKAVFNVKFWPQGIVLREFTFDNHFLQKPGENKTTE